MQLILENLRGKKSNFPHLPCVYELRYQCSEDTLKQLQDQDAIALRYRTNPNGSVGDIAGITNTAGNVMGLMPHPERACDPATGGVDGRAMLEALLG